MYCLVITQISEQSLIVLWRILGIVTFVVFIILNKQLAESEHRNAVKHLGSSAPSVIMFRIIGYLISFAILLCTLFINLR